MTLSRANKTYNKRAKMALVRSSDPSNSSEYLPRQAFWPSFMTGQSKMWLSIFEQCDLVFYPRWPIFELDLEIIKTNFQTNFQDTCIKTVATRVVTFFYIFSSCDLVFLSKMTYVRTHPSNYLNMHSDQVWW
jgi:hypothetical protein